MQTHFTDEQRRDPSLAEAESILRRCVHCGLCTATCPTYLLTGDERDSPRGRIYLMKDMFEQASAASPEITHHIDRCLSCLSCMTTCPSGVDYMHLVDLARAHILETGERPASSRLARRLVAATVPYPARFRLSLLLGRLARPFTGLFKAIGLKEMAAMLSLVPRGRLGKATYKLPGTVHAPGGRLKRVIMLEGCAQKVLRPDINDATIRLLTRIGIEVIVPERTGCCGALVHHLGEAESAREQALRNVEAWSLKVLETEPEAIIVNASGCGTMVKDYGHLLKYDRQHSEQAEQMARLALDISEYLALQTLGPPKRWSSIRVAYHSPCSLQHGQRVISQPRDLLRKAGFAVIEVPEGHICCGSAGTYNMLQPALSQQLRERKVANIERTKPDVIATGNIGCIQQIAAGTDIPIVHTVELLDWAYGGPCPRGLEALEFRVRDVPEGELPNVKTAVTAR
jgi:glycolate oxidase iron-sulfur subunit